QNADFHGAEFTQNADFSGATFKGIASFGDSTFEKYSPLFVTTNDELGETYRAQFVALPIDQEAHDFTVSEGSFRIPPGEAELGDGVKHHIPVGTVLFDPDSWDEEKQKYTRVSDPAKPLENSDTEEEKPAG
ncbi:pentapeptide repeat-containing protein, partial [Rothia mucilaginosa]